MIKENIFELINFNSFNNFIAYNTHCFFCVFENIRGGDAPSFARRLRKDNW